VSSAADRVRNLDWSALDGLDLREPIARILANEPAERVLDRFLRSHRDFTAAQRRVTAEALFGVGLWRRRLKAQGGDLLHALTHLGSDPEDFADRHSLPDWLAAELQRTPDPEALADALNLPGPVCLRARDDRDALARDLNAAGIETRPGAHAKQCLVVTSERPNLLALGCADFEVQDEGSQLLGELVGVRPGDTVLDLCAGAGGKSLQLAALGAKVYAYDVDRERLERLRRRAERAAADVTVLGEETVDADAVLVDAPCSELGALRRGPDLRWRIDPATFARWPQLQLELLERGARHARRRLVYATCTFRREENEDVCAAFEARHPELRRSRELFRCWPHVEGTDAFFGAVYERH